MPPGLAQKLGLEGAQPAPAAEATPPDPTPAPAPTESGDASAFGKMLANETSFGGSPGATARGAQAAGWLGGMFGPKDEIPREYTRSGSTDERAPIEQNVRDDLALQEREHPKSALAAKGAALVDHAALAAGAATVAAPLAEFAPSTLAIPAGGAAFAGGENAIRAHNANQEMGPAFGAGTAEGERDASLIHGAGHALAWVPELFGNTSRAARGMQIAGTGANIEKSAADLARADVPQTFTGVGQTAEDLGLPKATSVMPMSGHDYAHAAQGVRDTEKGVTDAAVRAASLPPEVADKIPPSLARQTMLPPSSAASEALGAGSQIAKSPPVQELRQGVRFGNKKSLDMRPADAETGLKPDQGTMLRDAEYPAPLGPPTGRPPGKVSKAEVAKALADMRAQAGGRIDPDAAASERALRGMEKRLEPLPEHLTPEQALRIRRGLDKASGFRPGEVVVPGGKEGVQGGGHAVREQLRTAMNETPHGPTFEASQSRASKAAALQGLAERASKGAGHRALGTGTTAAFLGGGLEGIHGGMHADTGTLATAALTGAGAAGARHYGLDVLASGLKGAEKVTSSEHLLPGTTASTLDIWAVKEKRKNETDPEYRKQQRRAAANTDNE